MIGQTQQSVINRSENFARAHQSDVKSGEIGPSLGAGFYLSHLCSFRGPPYTLIIPQFDHHLDCAICKFTF
jgi:hypothetical protein